MRADAATVIAKAPTVTAAARELGVDRSTLHRWIAERKVPKPAGRRKRVSGPASGQTPDAWARWVRRKYALSSTEQQILTMACQAMKVAADGTLKPETRLSAMKVADRLVARLDLEEDPDGEVETTNQQQSNVAPFRRA